MEIANKLETRADYIRQLTQSLANPNGSNSAPATATGPTTLQEGELMGDDMTSLGGDTVSILYKYGKEASIMDQERSTRSSGSFTTVKGAKNRIRSGQSLDSAGVSELKSTELAARDSTTVSYAEDPHVQFLLNKEQNKIKLSQKLVSGSQFRNITKLGGSKCEQCLIFDRVNKKHKETIRSLRLQIARLEEQNHDLKRYKSSDGHHILLKPTSGGNVGGGSLATSAGLMDDEDEEESLEFLIQKCETYEADLAKMKKMLLYERGLNEGLRKTLDETRTSLRDELATCQAENAKLREDWQKEKARRELLQVSSDESTTTLLRYKQLLEKTESKLSDCQLQLNAVKSNVASVDHLKEIERLRSMLAAAENSARTLSAQLNAKEHELSRVTERLTAVEGQVASLEERRAAAETHLARTQTEMKEVQDALQSCKKHAAVVQDSLNAAVKEKDSAQRSLAQTQTTLEHSIVQNAELQQEIDALNAKIADLLKKIAKDDENTKKALEKAITASVRLCVVAPTVNVHVSDKKLKFKAGLTQDALKAFLSKEVLEKYSFLFKQKHENSAPDGSNLEPWLQALLGQMQTSIEQHVNAAMDGSAM